MKIINPQLTIIGMTQPKQLYEWLKTVNNNDDGLFERYLLQNSLNQILAPGLLFIWSGLLRKPKKNLYPKKILNCQRTDQRKHYALWQNIIPWILTNSTPFQGSFMKKCMNWRIWEPTGMQKSGPMFLACWHQEMKQRQFFYEEIQQQPHLLG